MYSKGMRQKVLLASALLHDPAVFVLDELLSGLDADAESVVSSPPWQRASLRILELRMRTFLDRSVASPTRMFAASSDE
jgi:Fe-S cluster assembly ATPase SufC